MAPRRPSRFAPALTAGVDEAGRGCLAGPVVAGAVILPERYDLPGLTDSKLLTAERRETLAAAVKAQALAWSLGVAWPPEIDRINILNATLAAMARAVLHLRRSLEAVVIDGNRLIPSHLLASLPSPPRQEAVVEGDRLVPAISAASILAKTFRDKLLAALDKRYPGYGLAQHKGYGVAEHLERLRALGPCRIHRLTFKGVQPETKAPAVRQAGLPGL